MSYQEETPNPDYLELLASWVQYSYSPNREWIAETKKRREQALRKDDDNA